MAVFPRRVLMVVVFHAVVSFAKVTIRPERCHFYLTQKPRHSSLIQTGIKGAYTSDDKLEVNNGSNAARPFSLPNHVGVSHSRAI